MLVKMFEEQVRHNSDHFAVQTKDEKLTYAQLNRLANQIAHTVLERDSSSSPVGLLFEHGVDMIAGMLGALKTGRIYVPLDPLYPENRLHYMVDHSDSEIIVTNQQSLKLAHRIAQKIKKSLHIIDIDSIAANTSTENVGKILGDEQIAYILYTSGSTGNPKGVVQTHRNIWHFIKNYTRDLAITRDDRLTLFSSFCHDAAVMDIYGGLLNGAALYPVNIKNQVNLHQIPQWLIAEKITIWHSVPTVYRAFIQNLTEKEKFPDLRLIVLGGENVIEHDVSKFKELFLDTVLVNLYGQTESSYNSAQFIHPDRPFRKVTLGEPVQGTELLVVTDKGMEAAPLEEGEVLVISPHVAINYWKDEMKTHEVFINHPELGRLYKTGDIGKLLLDGSIEYVGRKDFQVKIRGYRIELGEIESQLLRHPAVSECVVIANCSSDNNRYLAAFIVPRSEIAEEELRNFLHDSLPDYMIPTYLQQVSEIPVTPTNKVDRKALMQIPLEVQSDATYVLPTTNTQIKLSKIWGELLRRERLGINDNFFKVGGNSLLATRLVSKIYQEFDVEIPLREIFTSSTISELAECIDKAQVSKYTSIPVVEELEYYPVSSAQKRLFILNQLEGNSLSYNMPKALYVHGNLDIDSLRRALTQLVMRQDSLRTTFHIIDGEIVQRIHQDLQCEVLIHQVQKEEVSDLVRSFIQPFDLGEAPLLRVEVLKLKDQHLILFDMHHIISDGVSMGILAHELAQLYAGQNLPELPIQYKDYAVWQNNFLLLESLKSQEAYWLEKLAGELPVLDLSTDRNRPQVMGSAGRVHQFMGTVELREKLTQLSLNHETTLYMLLLAAYNVLLAKYTGQDDLIVGSPIAGRSRMELENLIGMFVNTLVMRNYPKSEKSFQTFLTEVKETVIEAFENQEYPFEMLVEKLEISRDLSRNPLFDTMLTLQNTVRSADQTDSPGLFSAYEVENRTTKFDLELMAVEMEDGIHFRMQYSTDLFTERTMQQMGRHFLKILEEICNRPEQLIGEIDLLSPEEKQQIICEFNNNRREFLRHQTIYQVFEERTAKEPNKVAIRFLREQWNYRQVNESANQIGRVLKEAGIAEDQLVGILLERSPLMMECILAVWKARGAYIPLDPDYPAQRVKQILNDSNTKVLLTVSSMLSLELREEYSGTIIELDLDSEKIHQQSVDNLDLGINMQSLAYVIYTSGSTGKPKGAMVEHVGMMNHMQAKINDLHLREQSIVAQNSSHCFDISVWQFFVAFLVGGQTVIYPNTITLNPNQLLDHLIEDKVTILEVVPSYLSVLLDTVEFTYRPLDRIEYLLVTGEVVKPKLVRRWFAFYPNIPLVNAYGPAEASDSITHYIMRNAPDMDNIPIGRPLQNMKIYIVNKNIQLCPVGVKGEICVAGVGVGRGYLNDPEKTAQVFREDTFSATPGVRLYQTGDLGRWLEDGVIEFIGRKDYQVKIRGYRIEIGEIENTLMNYSRVKETVVMDVDDSFGNKFLCAYIVPRGELTVSEIRQYLLASLPEYMVPTHFIFLEHLPLNSNGKIDRKALPPVGENVANGGDYVAPTNELEEKLAKIWANLLGRSRVGISDHFFEIGGHSLKVISFISKVLECFNVQLTMKEFFKDPTIRSVAKFIESHQTNISDELFIEPYIIFNEGKEVKLFCFPPGRGFGLAYTNLSRVLDTYTLYAFNFIEDMKNIQEYAKIINEAQPDGAILLIGYSAGGNLAFDVAKELNQQGRTVSDLILFDVQQKGNTYPTLLERENAARNVLELLEENPEYGVILAAPGVREKIFSKVLGYLEYMHNFVVTGTMNGDIYMIKEEENSEVVALDTREEWGAFTKGDFYVYQGFGLHGAMLSSYYAEKNGQIVKEILEKRIR